MQTCFISIRLRKQIRTLSHFVSNYSSFRHITTNRVHYSISRIISLAMLGFILSACQSTIRFSSRAPSASAPSVSSLSPKERANSQTKPSLSRTTTARPSLPMLTRTPREEHIVSLAERWLGTPYRYGSTLRTGTDCSGFVMRVYEANGQSIPRSTKDQYLCGLPIDDLTDLRAGDLLFFNTNGVGVSHVGLYTGGDTVIHASSTYGVVKQSFTNTYLSKAYIGARRMMDVRSKQ
jgi:cell wall-associated NlpC family hydrolase